MDKHSNPCKIPPVAPERGGILGQERSGMASHQGVKLSRHLIFVAVVVQSTLFLSLVIAHPLDRYASGQAWHGAASVFAWAA